MRRLALVIVCILSGQVSPAQEPGKAPAPEIFVIVEQMPEYPGGQRALAQDIMDSLRIPETCRADSAFRECKVFVKFIVHENGDPGEPDILKGCAGCAGLDREVARVIKSLRPWNPGRQAGIPVKVYYQMPVMVKIR